MHLARQQTADLFGRSSSDRPRFLENAKRKKKKKKKKKEMGVQFDFFSAHTEPICMMGHMHISWLAVLI